MTRFIDTNIFIYALTAHPQFGETARHILERTEKGEDTTTSTLVLNEIAWVLEAMGKQGDIKPTLEKITSYKNLKITQITTDDLIIGANNMATEGVDFNDAVNLAIMNRLNISEVYTNDKKHLGKIETIKIIFE